VYAVSWLTDPDEEWSTDGGRPSRYSAAPTGGPVEYRRHPDEDEPSSGRLKVIALVLAGWLVVSIVVLCVLLLVRGPHSSSPSASASSKAASSSAASGSPAAVIPDGWIQQAADSQTDCRAHSYGQVQTFFVSTPCTTVQRSLLTTNQGGRTVVVASYVVSFDSATKATKFKALVTADGTGNINDLLREGVQFSGAPAQLSVGAAFASRQQGARVMVAEASYTNGTSSADDATLKSAARQATAAS
jgi:hypothetical protein